MDAISDLLSNYPLYKNVEVEYKDYQHPLDFEEIPFTFYCENCKHDRTFLLYLEPIELLDYAYEKLANSTLKNKFKNFNKDENKISFVQSFSGTCQYCDDYKCYFLLKVDSNGPIMPSGSNSNVLNTIQKIGQYPPFDIKPDKEIINYLNKEDKENYKKALICYSQSYGIGSYAYLRRIVENEILRIINDLANLDLPDSEKIKNLISEYTSNHQMSNLIESINRYLPSSLKSLGNNPLKVLHNQLSGGLHEFSEEKCLTKSEQIITLLTFVIKKLKEEGSEIKSARDAMKKLNG